MNCHFCSSPLEAGNLMCSHCKQRNPLPTGSKALEGDPQKQIKSFACAECHTHTLKYIELGSIEKPMSVIQCSHCKGLFLSKKLLDEIVLHYGWAKKRMHRQIEEASFAQHLNATRGYHCPMCNDMMKRSPFKISANVIIDECQKHGVWLNHGELQALIVWKKKIKAGQNEEKASEAYLQNNRRNIKSAYTYAPEKSSHVDDFLHWILFGGGM